MCNLLHKDHEPIPKKGMGWKIVFRGNHPMICLSSGREYGATRSGWVNWDLRWRTEISGFCVFLARAEARKCLKAWITAPHRKQNNQLRVVRIEYRRGLGRHIERRIINEIPFKIAIVRSFRFTRKGG